MELVLLAPLLVLVLMFVTATGRMVDVSMAVRDAAESGARAASQVSAARMASVGAATVMSHIGDNRMCRQPRVTVTHEALRRPARVTVTAWCTVSRRGLIGVVPVPRTIYRMSTEVIDVYTHR